MPNNNQFAWDKAIALVGPATVPIDIGTGSTAGTITLPDWADSTREILIGGTSDGNIRVKFLNQTTTSVTIPVKAGQRYPWAVTKVFIAATSAVDNVWGFC